MRRNPASDTKYKYTYLFIYVFQRTVLRVVTAKENSREDEYLDIQSILLEFIAGHSLRDLIPVPCAPVTKEE
jgi:hypothetical protein